MGQEANKEGEEGKDRETPGKWNSPVRRQREGEAVRYEIVIIRSMIKDLYIS